MGGGFVSFTMKTNNPHISMTYNNKHLHLTFTCAVALCHMSSQPGLRWKEWPLSGKRLSCHNEKRTRGWAKLCTCFESFSLEVAWLQSACSPSIGQRSPKAKPNDEGRSAHHLQEGSAVLSLTGRQGDPLQLSVNANSRPQQVLLTATIINL